MDGIGACGFAVIQDGADVVFPATELHAIVVSQSVFGVDDDVVAVDTEAQAAAFKGTRANAGVPEVRPVRGAA